MPGDHRARRLSSPEDLYDDPLDTIYTPNHRAASVDKFLTDKIWPPPYDLETQGQTTAVPSSPQHPWTPWDPPVQSPTPAPQWPGGRAQNSHNSAYCHHPSPACVCTHLYDPRFPNPSNQVSAVVRTQGHHPASPNPSSSQFPMSSRAPVSQVSSALIVSPGSLQQDPNDPTYYHQQDIGSVGDFFFYNPTYPISFRSQGAPDSVGPAASDEYHAVGDMKK